jgi:hypothetical protein
MAKGTHMTFRTRGDLRDRIAVAAAEHRRSLSEEVEHRLEMSFQYEERLRELSDRLNKTEEAGRRWIQIVQRSLDFILGTVAGLPKPASSEERGAAIVQALQGARVIDSLEKGLEPEREAIKQQIPELFAEEYRKRLAEIRATPEAPPELVRQQQEKVKELLELIPQQAEQPLHNLTRQDMFERTFSELRAKGYPIAVAEKEAHAAAYAYRPSSEKKGGE